MKKSFEQARRRPDGERYKHDLGQHYLYDTSLLERLVQAAGVTATDAVLEIGAGAGTLTTCLSRAARQVIAVEVDETVLPLLRVSTEACGNVEILHADIRRVDLHALSERLGNDFLVVANIPYNITTPILDLFWGSGLPVRQLSVMVQKEVADKLIAAPSTAAYGLTSIRCQFYCEPSVAADIPASAFTPPPKVDSAFVNLPFRPQPVLPVADEALLWRLVKASFNLRRKTLSNALRGATTLSSDALTQALEAAGVSPTARGEALDVAQWIRVANEVQRLQA